MGEMLKLKDNNGVYFIKNEDGTYSALEYLPFSSVDIISDKRPWWKKLYHKLYQLIFGRYKYTFKGKFKFSK